MGSHGGSRAGGGGAKGGSGGSAGAGARTYSSAESKIRQAESRKEMRQAVNDFVEELSPGDTFTTAVTNDYQFVTGAGEVLKDSVRNFTVSQNKTLVNMTSGKEYTPTEFANAIYSGRINLNAIQSGVLSPAEFANKRYKSKGTIK